MRRIACLQLAGSGEPLSGGAGHGRRALGAVGLFLLGLVGLALIAAQPARALPNGYAYEMASPPDKNGGGAYTTMGFWGGTISADGERVAFASANGFADAIGVGGVNYYVAARGPQSWSTGSIMPAWTGNDNPVGAGPTVSPASEDLTKTVVCTNTDLQTRQLHPHWLLYLRDNVSRTYTLLSPDPVAGGTDYPSAGSDPSFCQETKGWSPDLRYVMYAAPAQLTADSLGVTGNNKIYLVDTETEEIELVSILPDGTPVSADTELEPFINGVSADGTVAYFKYNADLYRRDLVADETVLINADPVTGEPAGPEGDFLAASRDGRYVFFFATADLVPADTNGDNDVYRYDAAAPAGQRRMLISVDSEPADGTIGTGPGGVEPLAASQSGDRIYFEAAEGSQLVAGAPTDPGPKWYLWDDGELKYVASRDTDFPAAPGLNRRFAHTNSSASHLAFQSSFDAGASAPEFQIWVYDAEASTATDPEWVCASCVGGDPAATPRRGSFLAEAGGVASETLFGSTRPHPNRLLNRPMVTDAGAVLFTTTAPLLPEDRNGAGQDNEYGNDAFPEGFDVYLYRDGELELVSTGRAREEGTASYGISRDGNSIAIATKERLSRWDVDDAWDVYVARRGGGLPEPPVPAPACAGDECQGLDRGAPGAVAAGSASLVAAPAAERRARCKRGSRGGREAKRRSAKRAGGKASSRRARHCRRQGR